jgi:hypothetical protein
MDELKSLCRYWCMVFWVAVGEIGIFSAIVATGSGMTAVLLAAHFGFAQKGEIPELIFITVVSAIAGVVLEFAIRLFLLVPSKIHKDDGFIIAEKQSEVKRLADEIQKIKEQSKPFEIYAVSTTAILASNSTIDEQVLLAKNNLADCSLEIHNPNPTQAIDGIELRLLTVDPPMESAKDVAHQQFVDRVLSRPSRNPKKHSPGLTEICDLRYMKFQLLSNELKGDQGQRFRLFRAERSVAGLTVVKFNCQQMDGMVTEFTPSGEHVFTIEVGARGIQTKPTQFKLVFFLNPEQISDNETAASTKSKEPVFTIKKTTPEEILSAKEEAKVIATEKATNDKKRLLHDSLLRLETRMRVLNGSNRFSEINPEHKRATYELIHQIYNALFDIIGPDAAALFTSSKSTQQEMKRFGLLSAQHDEEWLRHLDYIDAHMKSLENLIHIQLQYK